MSDKNLALSVAMVVDSLKFSAEAFRAMGENTTWPESLREQAIFLNKEIENFLENLFRIAGEVIEQREKEVSSFTTGEEGEC